MIRDIIKNKHGINILLKHNKAIEPSQIFCDKIQYMRDRGKFENQPVFDHHLMFYLNGLLIFKVWLRNKKGNKEYKNIYEALKDVGFILLN